MKPSWVALLAALALTPTLALTATLAFAQSAQQRPAPKLPGAMTRQALEDEVARSRAIIQGGAVMPRRPAGCTSAESRQFDFWLGEWDVSPAESSVIVAESSISLHDQGCVILENWRPFRDAHGHSINVYDSLDKKWHQTWADASGVRTEYAGALDADGVLRLDNLSPPQPGAPTGHQRMNFQRVDANTVRQWGEAYSEASQTWTTNWSFTYRRRDTR